MNVYCFCASQPRAYNKKVSPAKKTDTTTSATEPEVSLQQELAAKTKGEALKDKLRMAAAENLYSEKVKMYAPLYVCSSFGTVCKLLLTIDANL